MPFPVVAATTYEPQSSLSYTHTVTIPAGTQAGDLLLVLVSMDGTPTLSGWPAGWTELVATPNGTTRAQWVYAKIATAGETSFAFSSSFNRRSETHCLRITGADAATAPAVAAAVAGTSDTSPNPPSLNPAAWDVEDALWLATYGGQDAVTQYPSTYPDNRYSGATGARTAYASRNLAAASDDPSVYALSGGTGWVAHTIAVRPAPSFVQQVAVY